MAGAVSNALRRRLRAAVEAHGLVVWFDPDGRYAAFVAEAGDEVEGAPLLRYAGSYIALRRAIEPYIALESEAGVWQERAGQVIAYVPAAPDQINDALCDALACGRAFAPKAPGNLNSGLHVIARQGLAGRLPPDALETAVRQAESGALSLADLDRMGEGAGGGVLDLIFGTASPAEIALRFLTGPAYDAELAARGAIPELQERLTAAIGLPDAGATGEGSAAELRARLERYVLTADFVLGLKDLAPAALANVELPRAGSGRNALLALAAAWRNSRDAQESYRAAAQRVAEGLGPDVIADLPLPALERTATFQQAELALQAALAEGATTAPTAPAALRDEARRRADGFWASANPAHRERWRMLAEAAAMLALADDIARALKPAPGRLTAAALVQAYTSGDDPWCLIDRHHRTLLRHFHGHVWPEGAPAGTVAAIERLVALTRHRHAEVVSDLAEAFVAALGQSQYSVPGVLAQADLFAQQLGASPPGRTAYMLVDALRFEMAHDLAAGEIAGWQSALTPAIATFPSITPIGMAALMPGAERGITLAAKGKQLVVEIGGHDVTGRAKRIAQLRRTWPDVVECKLGDLRPAKPTLRKHLEGAQHVLVTSQEIDEVAETSGGAFARSHMTGVLDDLRSAFRTLSAAGIERIIVTADHGHLFGDDVSEGEKIDAPGGETIELHRRVWIGRGGDTAPGYVRMQASDLGLGGDLEFATPRSTAVFTAAGGSNDYFHGGLSLQEMVIPVLELTRVASAAQPGATAFRWELIPGSKTISSRFCTVRIGGGTGQQQLALLAAPPQPPVARVELRVGSELAGVAIAASYGFREASGEVDLRLDAADPTRIEPNTVTFQMAERVKTGAATAVLIDAVTGRELARFADIPVSIAF